MVSEERAARALVAVVGTKPSLELVISVWLHEKGGVSEGTAAATRTHHTYAQTLGAYRARLRAVGLDLDSADDRQLALMAQAFAAERDPSSHRTPGKPVAAATFNQRLAILSSFYEFGRKRRLLLDAREQPMLNPIEQLGRRKVQAYRSARPLDAREVARTMAAIDRESLEGLRDYALLSVGLSTGRRLAELAAMRWGCVEVMGGQMTLTFQAKGDKEMRDTLSPSVSRALMEWLYRWYGTAIGRLSPDAPLWVSLVPCGTKQTGAIAPGHPLSPRAISNLCLKRVGTSKVHTLRHTFAHGMEAVGASVSEIQARLGHSNIQTTGIYLTQLSSPTNAHADDLALLFGLK